MFGEFREGAEDGGVSVEQEQSTDHLLSMKSVPDTQIIFAAVNSSHSLKLKALLKL